MENFIKIPDKNKCFKLLQKYNFPQRKMEHVILVEKVALFLGTKLKDRGYEVNIILVSSGALLHDIDKGIEGSGEVHSKKGVEVLKKEGYPEIARICETHTINSFLDKNTIPSTWEEKIVALSDKMVKDEIITVDERYKLWMGEDLPKEQKEILHKSYPIVKELEKEIFGIIGIKPEEVKYKLI